MCLPCSKGLVNVTLFLVLTTSITSVKEGSMEYTKITRRLSFIPCFRVPNSRTFPCSYSPAPEIPAMYFSLVSQTQPPL